MTKEFYWTGAVVLAVCAFALFFSGAVPLPPILQPLVH